MFKLTSHFKPCGDQSQAINNLVNGLEKGFPRQTLWGVTGSGKTFTMANVIEKMQKQTLIISHNKTLAAQLASELKMFFPENAVEYFVSYYDYYQPEVYIAHTDTYIEKDAAINEQIDRLRHSATHSILTRKDVIVVASVSCIYGLGSPEDYKAMHVYLEKGITYDRDKLLRDLISLQYERNDIEFRRGVFRVKGDVIDIYPAYEENKAIRIEFFGDEIDGLYEIDPLKGKKNKSLIKEFIYPASHYVIPKEKLDNSIDQIREELEQRVKYFEDRNMLLEAQRVRMRTNYDIEMMQEMGYCQGIENYSRYMSGRKEGQPPFVLLDYFDKDFLVLIDESHASIPQVRAMYNGDKSRKDSLVEHGFRLPSAYDNRPLKFQEFEKYLNNVIFVSATPADYEFANSKQIVEQVIRPTGLMDPAIIVRPAENQVDDLIGHIREQVKAGERTLVTTLTKRMSEDLANYLKKLDVKVHYLHSELDTIERLNILKKFRLGEYDVIVGINLLREGLDLPEVSLVAILDADK
ncbi:excinuclease ABC subunit UvrB, partial [bacterium]|nr:excinuclease ABC subunit UvrB [bacterium]